MQSMGRHRSTDPRLPPPRRRLADPAVRLQGVSGLPVHAAHRWSADGVSTYPLGLGIWLAFTDTTIGQPGEWIGLNNFISLFDDPVFWLSVTNTIFYTATATVGKFALGLWLALLLNHHIPFKAFMRAILLLPWIVPTDLSAIAW